MRIVACVQRWAGCMSITSRSCPLIYPINALNHLCSCAPSLPLTSYPSPFVLPHSSRSLRSTPLATISTQSSKKVTSHCNTLRKTIPYHTIPHTIPYHTVPYHKTSSYHTPYPATLRPYLTIPHTIIYHTIPYIRPHLCMLSCSLPVPDLFLLPSHTVSLDLWCFDDRWCQGLSSSHHQCSRSDLLLLTCINTLLLLPLSVSISDDLMIGDAKDYPPHIINAVALTSYY